MRLLLAILMLVACSPGGRGMLEPVAGPGVVLASTHGLPNDTVRLDVDGVQADVTGAWSNTGPSIEIVYRAGIAPALIPATSAARWDGRSVPANNMWDQTVPEPGSVMGRQLLDTKGLKIAPHGKRTVLIFYDAPEGVKPPTYGDTVTVDVPMSGGSRPVTFKAGAE